MKQGFEAAFIGLNQAQKRAVEYIDGPLLVIAGPGTGKTQLLSLRVANILSQTDTDPSQILCLTFTNAAVNNMKDRLLKLVGASARNVSVRTFHSFASEIMQDYSDYFWNGARLGVVPDAVQRAIIEDLLSQLPLDNPLSLKFAGNYTSTTDVLAGLRLAKEAGLTPAKLLAMTQLNMAYIDLIEDDLAEITKDRLNLKQLDVLERKVKALPDQNILELVAPLTSLSHIIKSSLLAATTADKKSKKTTETGKWKRRWVQTTENKRTMISERSRNDWWKHLTEVYALYRDRLHERGYYDYSDMLVEVISALEQKPELLSLVQERYLYVLIDEFQDTNAAQLRLAHLVSTNPIAKDKPNLMAVGDDDQSIFAFNGAELSNMSSFVSLYPKTKTIVLTDNYRSTQAILDISATIINQAETRLAASQNFSKTLTAAQPPEAGEIKHFIYPTREHQLEFVARHIKAAWDDNPTQTIAVLARSHKSLRDLSSYLTRLKVPIAYEQQNNILELELIKQVVLLSQITVAISEGNVGQLNYGLGSLLAYPAWEVSPKTLWSLALSLRTQKQNWLEALGAHKDKSLNVLSAWLLDLSAEAKKEPLPVIIEYLIGLRELKGFTSPLKHYFEEKQSIDSSYLASLSGLSVLMGLTHEFVATSKNQPTLKDFSEFIQMTNRVTDSSWYLSSTKAVELLSIHRAKGLEFDKVYIIDAIEPEWQPRRAGRKSPANLPLAPYGEQFDDYARLAYVAATRSRSSLVVSSFSVDPTGQPQMTSPLFSSFEQIDVDQVSEEDSAMALQASLSQPKLSSHDEKLLLTPRLENYRLSATGLIQFLDTSQGGPKQFLDRQLLRLPTLTTPYMAYGTAMHYGLQTAQNLINHGSFSLAKVTAAYEAALKNQYLPESDLARYLDHGKATIARLFNEYSLNLSKGDLSEVVLNELNVGKAQVNGTLDHIHLDNNQLIITDYKTGTPLSSFTTKDKAKAIKAWRQKTQLLFYCLLGSQSNRFKAAKSVKAQIIYVEADTQKLLSLSLTPTLEELSRTSRLIEAVWKRIEALDFIDTSSYEDSFVGIKAFEDYLLK